MSWLSGWVDLLLCVKSVSVCNADPLIMKKIIFCKTQIELI